MSKEVGAGGRFDIFLDSAFLDAFRTNSRNIIGRNPSMVIPLLANQDLTPMLSSTKISRDLFLLPR